MTKEIFLTRGKVAIVDDCDYVALSDFTWCVKEARTNWYAITRVRGTGQPGEKRYMHRVIVGAVKGQEVDHINRDTLDNRRSNLRIVTRSENGRNRPKQQNNTSGFKGVSHWHDGRWQAAIKLHGKRIALGLFDDLNEAALAYDDAARRLHGEFAKLNFS